MPLLRLLIVFLFVSSSPALAQPAEGGFADLVEKLSPAVVNISTTQKVKQAQAMRGMPFQFFGPDMQNNPELEPFREFFEQFNNLPQGQPQEKEVYSLGSGFIIDAQGHVITNNHVIDGAQEITVTLSTNEEYKAKVLGRDAKTDLALLKIDSKKPLPHVTLGDSDSMRVGDWVIAIGNPFGLGGSVTQGIISARQRSINAGPYDDFLQTDAPINRGNSGGPLFNIKGEVIGINSAIFSPSGGSVGIGFAIPTTIAKNVIAQLKEHGRTFRGWLGVKIQEVTKEVADSVGLDKARGALVAEVTPESPAVKAGLQAGDIILSFDGKPIDEMRFLPRMVAETTIGKKAAIEYWRGGKTHTTSLTVGELDEQEESQLASGDDNAPKEDTAFKTEKLGGMELAVINPQIRARLKLDKDSKGVVVLEVEAGSEASKKGLRRGDVIVDINGAAIATTSDVKKALADAAKKGRAYALAKVRRGNEDAFVPLPVADK